MGLLDMFYAYVGVMVETGACGEVQALYVFSSAGMVYAHCREFICHTPKSTLRIIFAPEPTRIKLECSPNLIPTLLSEN